MIGVEVPGLPPGRSGEPTIGRRLWSPGSPEVSRQPTRPILDFDNVQVIGETFPNSPVQVEISHRGG